MHAIYNQLMLLGILLRFMGCTKVISTEITLLCNVISAFSSEVGVGSD